MVPPPQLITIVFQQRPGATNISTETLSLHTTEKISPILKFPLCFRPNEH